jgi:polysaccharide pyruvyl transferase WcaK-like protein
MKITFLGTHGQFNIGDELLLETFLSQLGEEHRYAVNSYDPEFTVGMLRPRFHLETFHTTRQLPRFLGHLLTSDLLFFGGGSIIKELYASVGRNRYATLGMILASVTFTKQVARKKVLMSNIGVGPLLSPGGERLARMILQQVDFLSVRDDKSLHTCLKLGIPAAKVRRVPDAVFANRPQALLRLPATPPADSLHLALNLNYDIENRAAWEVFLQNLAEALIQLHAVTPLTLHALPMQSKFKTNDDLTVLKDFFRRIPAIPHVLHEPQTAQEAAEIISSCHLVLAERLHTLVLAAILGKPFFGLVYDVKVQELVEYLGMSAHSLNINQPFGAKTLQEGLQAVWREREFLHEHLTARSAALRAELDSYFGEVRERIAH